MQEKRKLIGKGANDEKTLEVDLDTFVREKLGEKEGYVWNGWHNQGVREQACGKAKLAVLSEFNGWFAQATRLRDEVLTLVTYDRALATVDFVNRMGGKAKIFANTRGNDTRVVSSGHDWEMKQVNRHGGMVPSGVTLFAARLKQNGFYFDEYLVGEPVPKPVPKPARSKDPVLVGALDSPLGRCLVEIGRWNGVIPGMTLGWYGLELDAEHRPLTAASSRHGFPLVLKIILGLLVGLVGARVFGLLFVSLALIGLGLWMMGWGFFLGPRSRGRR